MNRLLHAGLVAALVVVAPGRYLPVAGAARVPNDDRTIVHVLNRMAFGPRPGDVDRVRALGVQRYIEQQLHPERLRDEAVAARLASLRTLRMGSGEIAEEFELPAVEARKDAARQKEAGVEPDARQKEIERRANQVVVELAEAKLLRAIYSDRQLEEVLTDFWFNHFNVDARKGPDRFMLTAYERDTIRPHVLGRFRDLLEATASSPAMLFYLDNWMSAAPPDAPNSRGRVLPRPAAAARGLNENYARELMELHTLGVEGGYTQHDVVEVARCFTGWTIDKPRQGGGFRFDPRRHDDGEKTVLGHRIKAGGGESDGEQVLDLLAAHPATATFISTKLVRKFVADAPPPALVARAAKRFRDTKGDLREVMRTILTSPEFLSANAQRTKVKTPFEFVASAVRAVGADVQEAAPLVRALQPLGMPLYQCQPPTGYRDTADAWVNTGALVARMNFAVMLAANRLPGIIVPAADAPDEMALTLGGPKFQER